MGTPEWLTLGREETVYLRAGPSKNLLLAGTGAGTALLVTVAAIVGALGDIATGRILSFAGLVVVLAILGGIYLFVRQWEYAVTSHRVCVASGVRSRETTTVRLADVESVTLEQSRWQRLVNVGDLLFVTGERTVRFSSIEDPRRVHEQVVARVE